MLEQLIKYAVDKLTYHQLIWTHFCPDHCKASLIVLLALTDLDLESELRIQCREFKASCSV